MLHYGDGKIKLFMVISEHYLSTVFVNHNYGCFDINKAFDSYFHRVLMVLNPLFEIRFVIAGGGVYSNYNLQCIKSDKERENVRRKKPVQCIQKTFNTIFKNGFNPVFSSIPYI